MLKNSIFQVIANIISATLNLLIIIFTARILGALGRGEITYLIIYLGILQIFTSIVGNSVMIFMLTKHSKQNVLFASLSWTVFTILISIPVIYYFTPLKGQSIFYLAFLALFQTSFSNLISFYSSELKFRLITILKAIQPMTLLLLIAIFRNYYTFNISFYWILLLLSFFPHFVLFLKEVAKNFKIITYVETKSTVFDFLKLGGLGQFTNLMQFASYRFAALIIAKTLNMSNVGIFGLWLSVIDAVWLIPIGLATVNMSYAAKKDYKPELVWKYILISITISFVLILLIIALPNQLYVYLLGKDFTELKSLIILSSPVVVLFTINIIIAYYFSAKGLIKYNTIASGSGFIAILLVTSYLTSKFGLRGAILANCISYTISILTILFLFLRYKKRLNLQSVSNN